MYTADARLDYLIEDVERAAEPCLDCEVGEPHMCRVIPPGSGEA